MLRKARLLLSAKPTTRPPQSGIKAVVKQRSEPDPRSFEAAGKKACTTHFGVFYPFFLCRGGCSGSWRMSFSGSNAGLAGIASSLPGRKVEI